jgi:hypothetical protein
MYSGAREDISSSPGIKGATACGISGRYALAPVLHTFIEFI